MTNEKTIFRTDWFKVKEIPSEPFWGMGDQPFYRIDSSDAVVALLLTDNDEMVLVRQFRPARNQQTLEFPAGFMESGATPAQAIRRELKEETGYVPGDLFKLGTFGLSVDRNSHSIIGFVALASKKVEMPKEAEFIQLVKCKVGDYMTMAESGEPVLLSDIGFFTLASQKMGSRLGLN